MILASKSNQIILDLSGSPVLNEFFGVLPVQLHAEFYMKLGRKCQWVMVGPGGLAGLVRIIIT